MSRAKATAERLGAIAYIRTSTARQELSPAAQRSAIEAWAAQRQIEILEWHEDLASKSTKTIEDRPVLANAIDAVRRRRATHLVVARGDRLARNVEISREISRFVAFAGGRIATADGRDYGEGDGPESQLIQGLLELVAEYELRVLRVRVVSALRAKRASGFRAGDIPLGYRLRHPRLLRDGSPNPKYDGKLVPDATERAAAVLAKKLDATHSLRAIGQKLAEKGYRPRSGGDWHPQTVRRLIQQETPA